MTVPCHEDDELENINARLSKLQAELVAIRCDILDIDMHTATTRFSARQRLGQSIRHSALSVTLAALEISAHCPVNQKSLRVRVHLASCAPRLLHTVHSLGEGCAALAWYHRYQYLTYANMAWWIVSFAVANLVFFDILHIWWPVVCMLLSPSVACVGLLVSTFHRKTTRILCRSFQTVFICVHTAALCISLCLMWRHKPSKVAAMIFIAPPVLFASSFMDATPEKSRRISSLAGFSMCVLMLSVFFSMLNIGLGSDQVDMQFMIFERSFGLSSIANGSLGSLFPFAAKNLLQNLLRPGSLVVVKSPIVSVKLEHRVYQVLCAANGLMVAETLPGNSKTTMTRSQQCGMMFTSIANMSSPRGPCDVVGFPRYPSRTANDKQKVSSPIPPDPYSSMHTLTVTSDSQMNIVHTTKEDYM